MSPIDFVVFAHARSGSTSLTRALNRHPDLRIAEEAFHPCYHEWHPDEPSYVEGIVDRTSLDRALREVGARYNAIKVLSYQLSEELYSHLLTRPGLRVVFLHRRNLLRSVVSGLVAEQTGAWQASDLDEATRGRYDRLEPIPVDVVAERLGYVVHCNRYFLRLLRARPDSVWTEVVYEDLYSPDLERNILRLRGIQAFLGVEPFITAEMVEYVDPARSRVNTVARYSAIPNAREIDAALGSDETGWLLGERRLVDRSPAPG